MRAPLAFLACAALLGVHLSLSAVAQQTQRVAAFDNATVQPAGVRPGDAGRRFFNIEGSANGDFASFAVADFDLGVITSKVIDVTELTLLITQSNAGFTTDGAYAVYRTDETGVSIQESDSPLTYQGGDGIGSVDPLLTNLTLLATVDFVEQADGAQDVATLDLAPIAATLVEAINAGEPLRLVFAPEAPTVAATYAGQGNSDGPPPTLEVTFLADEDPLAVYDIQGPGHRSPVEGQTVTTGGIVTAAGTFDAIGDADLQGFFLQDATGDGDLATSDAVFVASAASVAVGDEVSVTGVVEETGFPRELTYTRIGSPSAPAAVVVLSSGNALPAPVVLGQSGRALPNEVIDDDNFGELPELGDFDPLSDGLDFFESLEAMRVTVEDAIAVSATNRFGEIFAVSNVGMSATGFSARGTLNISPDDFNPEKIQLDPGRTSDDPALIDLPVVDTGELLGNVTGVVGYDFGNFQVQPTEPVAATPAGLEPEMTALQGDDRTMTVASYNVLNLDPNDADDNADQDVANGRFDAIAGHIVSALGIPDVIGLQEVQDNNGTVDDGTVAADQTLQLLADRIVAAGGPTYAFIDNPFIIDGNSGGAPGGNIRTAYLSNPSRVELIEGSVRTVDDRDAFAGARLPLIASFAFNAGEVTIVNNHFSSKGGSAPIFGTEQPFEALQEDPDVNGSLDSRQRQSREVQGFVSAALAQDPEAAIVVLGDLNEFEFISAVLEFAAVGLQNLTDLLDENERYTFNFQGNSQSLDHVLVSDVLAPQARVDAVHVNSEFADLATRASDHDPVVAAFPVGVDSDLSLAFAGAAIGAGADFDPQAGRFVFTPGVPGLARLTLSVTNGGDEASGVYFLQCASGEAPGALSIRRVRGARRAGFRPADVSIDNAGNPRVQIGSDGSPSVIGVPAGEARQVLVEFVGTGTGFDTLSCSLAEQDAQGARFREVGAIQVEVDNQP
ncbi:MAG: endonuclease/exonuclease/phosphatase family protein [Pseudomonadota bacterium]